MRYVLDTNIVSELTKARPDVGCIDWLQNSCESLLLNDDHFGGDALWNRSTSRGKTQAGS